MKTLKPKPLNEANFHELVLTRRGVVSNCSTELIASCRAVFAGSFRPLHDAHRQMAKFAQQVLVTEVCHEISAINVDKPNMTFVESTTRVEQFSSNLPVCISAAPTFLEKANLFPNSTFVCGADTICRISDPKYYGGERSRMMEEIEAIKDLGCRFFVFGRKVQNRFVDRNSAGLPDLLSTICDWVNENEFRIDMSSSELRENGKANRSN